MNTPMPSVIPPTPEANKATDALEVIAQLATDAQPPAVLSPSGSSVGWTFDVWLRKNKDLLKQAVSYISAGTVAVIGMIHIVPTGPWAVVVTALVGIATLADQFGTRLALDWIDYRYTNNPK